MPLLHQQHVTVTQLLEARGVPPTGSARGKRQPLRLDASSAAPPSRSPGGTNPARLGARRVCSWKAWPRCPTPLHPPSPRPGRKADHRAGSGSASSPSLSKGGAGAFSHLVFLSPTRHHPSLLESSYTWVKPKARLSRSPRGLWVSVSLLGSGVKGPPLLRGLRRGENKRRKRGKEKKAREKEKESKAAAPGPGWVRWRWGLRVGGNVRTRASASPNEVRTSGEPLPPLQGSPGSPVSRC